MLPYKELHGLGPHYLYTLLIPYTPRCHRSVMKYLANMLYVQLVDLSHFFFRAATNCELYVLSKKSLDEALKYYPNIFEQMQSAVDEMKYQLHKGDLQINTFTKPGSAGETFLRTGCKLFNVELMHLIYVRSGTQFMTCKLPEFLYCSQ